MTPAAASDPASALTSRLVGEVGERSEPGGGCGGSSPPPAGTLRVHVDLPYKGEVKTKTPTRRRLAGVSPTLPRPPNHTGPETAQPARPAPSDPIIRV